MLIRFKLFEREITSSVLRTCSDPMGRHETKYIVSIEGDLYGIPISEVIEYPPDHGQQLKLF